jgi:stearoyl-CoA desaturase (delta-9 desaturase)
VIDSILTFLNAGLLDLSIGGKIVAFFLFVQTTVFGVSIYLHRNQAHRAVELHPIVSHFFRFWLWLSTGQITKQWVAVHRKHHACCETDEDPHSPQRKGIRKVLMQGVELYTREAARHSTIRNYAHGCPDDWVEKHIYSSPGFVGLGLLLVVEIALFGVSGLAMWALQMVWIPFWAAGVINGIGHWWGYRNFETPDESRNIVPWGIMLGGEELHNNHHAFPSSARFSWQKWEFDISWWVLRALQAVKLAEIKKVSSGPDMLPDSPAVDLDNVRAVVKHRFYIMTAYCKDVIVPVMQDELQRVGRQTRRLVTRDTALLDDQARARLQRLLDDNPMIETVYRFRNNLAGIWNRSSANHEVPLRALQEWCREAEATGIQALQDFARTLTRYRLQPAAQGLPPGLTA